MGIKDTSAIQVYPQSRLGRECWLIFTFTLRNGDVADCIPTMVCFQS